jgi:hypothetical protein
MTMATISPIRERAPLLGAAVLTLLSCAAHGATTTTTAPSWVQQMTPGTWLAVGQNTIKELDPANDPSVNPNYPNSPPWRGMTGQSAVTKTWNGGAFANNFGAKGSLVAWGGGHQDYYGNEIYTFDMATQRWSRITNPFRNVSFPVSKGIWSDGSPSVPHTSAFAGYHPGTNSFACMLTQTSNSPANATVPVFFSFDTMRWRHAPQSPSGVQYGGWAVYDASRDAWWMEGGDSGGVMAKYVMGSDGTSGTWTNYSAKFNALDSRAGRDPNNDILVITTFRQNDNMYGLDLKNPSSNPVLLNQGGSPPSRDGAAGFEWSDTLQAFVYWRSGANVYQVKAPTGDWRTGTWTWTNLTAGSNAVTALDRSSAGIYNRFQLARYQDVEVAVVVNDTDGRVYAFRVPATPPVTKIPEPPTAVSAN